MGKSKIYVHVGKYQHDYDNYGGSSLYDRGYLFDNGNVNLSLSTDCCDYWEENDNSGKDFKNFLGKKYKKKSITGMNYKYIYYLAIKHNDDDETGSVTMYSKKHYCKIKYTHHHNGYYPSSFSYYTTLEDIDKSEEFNSDSDME